MKKALIILSLFFSILTLFEVYLRHSPFLGEISPVIYDSDLGMWHKKDFTGYISHDCYAARYQFDKNGLVKNLFPYNHQKPDIILLGDSYLEALMVKEASQLQNVLTQLLAATYNVLNYGLSGSSFIEHYLILNKKVNFKNTALVVHLVTLDNMLGRFFMGEPGPYPRPKATAIFENNGLVAITPPPAYSWKEKFRDFIGNFALYGYIKKFLYYFADVSPVDLKVDGSMLNRFYAAARKIHLFLQQKNIRYIQLFYTENKTLSQEWGHFLEQEHIEYVDLAVAFSQKNIAPAHLHYSCDEHWNELAHESLAHIVAPIIKK